MGIATFVISACACVAAFWAAWATHRQAKATESTDKRAQEALALAKAADERDQARQRVEERPRLTVDGKGRGSTRVSVTILNEGPVACDLVELRVDLSNPETARLVRGLYGDDAVDDIVPLGSAQIGETLTAVLMRTDPELSGRARLIVTARRDADEWASVHYLTLSRPHRVYAF